MSNLQELFPNLQLEMEEHELMKLAMLDMSHIIKSYGYKQDLSQGIPRIINMDNAAGRVIAEAVCLAFGTLDEEEEGTDE